MNKTLSLIFLFTFSLFGSQILSYNIYERTDRVDIMLTFDTPYNGKIVKSKYSSKIVLKLYDAKIESSKIKHVSSKFLKTLSINPMDGYTQIVATVPANDIVLKASKTTDAYGLRLRFTKKTALHNTGLPKQKPDTFGNLPTKSSNDLSTSYYIVVTVLIIGIVILLILKRKISSTSSDNKQEKNSWLFKGTPKAPQMKQTASTASDEVQLRFQKNIDEKNSVVMLDFHNQSYLILLGDNNNILLDKFTDNIPTTQNEFESLLKEKNTRLEEFLQVKHQSEHNEAEDDILKTFSKKASNIPYTQE